MAVTTYTIDAYRLYHFSESNANGQTAVITCFDNGAYKGSLYFYKEVISMPPSVKTSSGTLQLRFNERRFSEMVETFRQEKPLYINFNDATRCGWLSTSNEPIGEEES